ncbi:hypothetical protein AOQ84DRAFT_215684 [Glonium stellatum]|uniref:WKF domain-containing protein n=1 Tax=Glonium stellatum TaxID=574774 RepID=A0A8E2F4K6_9PEZI|nr:hypothetical protein AOQ84DRAFT_215684 [Glonium stellatum]
MPHGAVNPPTAHVPAWKRLGLTLKQSGDAVALPQELQKVEKKRIKDDSPRDLNGTTPTDKLDVVASVKGNPSGLGKRNFEFRAAEEDGEDDDAEHRRKKRASRDQTAGYDGVESQQSTVLAVGAQQNGTASCTALSASNASPRPKGDPNYRKKTGKSKDKPGNQSSSIKHDDISTTAEKTNADVRSQLENGQKACRPKLTSSETRASHATSGNGQGNSENDLRASTEATDVQLDSIIRRGSPTKVSKKAEKAEGTLETVPPSLDATTTPSLIRRKSVTFTPDTKTSDGNSAQELFKTWVTQQKGPSAEFTADEIAQFVPPPKLHPANDLPSKEPTLKSSKKESKKTSKAEKAKKTEKGEAAKPKSEVESEALQSDRSLDSTEKQSQPSKAELKAAKKSLRATESSNHPKKDLAPYLVYLDRYHKSRETWKFNKATQTDVLKNALNVFRIPPEYSAALKEYVAGLQGAAARDRLSDAAKTALKELDDSETAEEKAEDEDTPMDGAADRQAAHDSALRNRIKKERKRRRDEADEELTTLKRRRAEDILQALAAGTPIMPRPSSIITQSSNGTVKNRKITFEDEELSAPQPRARRRKLRANFSDDDSSSSSSSDESIPSPAASDDDSEEDSNDDSEEGEKQSGSSHADSETSSSSDNESSSSSDESDSESSDSDSDSD